MHRSAVGALVVPLLIGTVSGTASTQAAQNPSACKPSQTTLHASAVRVPGLSSQQVENATAIINAGAGLGVPQRGQTIAVMAALEASSLKNSTDGQAQGAGALGLFQQDSDQGSETARLDSTASAQIFYRALTKVHAWQNLTPTLAAHAAQRNLDPEIYTRWWPEAVRVVDRLTAGSGVAAMQNLAARAEAISDCEAATVRGRFSVSFGTQYVGQVPPTVLGSRALDLAQHGGDGWLDRCQNFVAVLDGRPHSGYDTALDAWQTFETEGVAHLVTGADGVAPPVGAWLYYRDSTNPAGHVATYLGNGQIASTDVFARGRVGVGPASAITDGPWHMQYLGWAPPWGRA